MEHQQVIWHGKGGSVINVGYSWPGVCNPALSVDPVTFEVIRHRLLGITDEQAANIMAISGSKNVTEMSDFNVGLYLPATAVESRQVQGGKIIATGPGTPMSEPASMDDEPWKIRLPDVKYLPMQANVGDYALFFRKAAVELTFEGKTYLVVPQAAILVLVRREVATEPE